MVGAAAAGPRGLEMAELIAVTCPHCGSTLRIDAEAGVVVDHTRPPVHSEKTDFDTRLREIEDEHRRASERMAEAMRMEKSREKIIEDRFRKLMDEAKKSKDEKPPIRDIDLD